MASGSWALAEELFARGDAAFVAEVRRIHDADRQGGFAARWLADPRPAARRLLIDYLSSLLARRLDPGRMMLADAVKLALHRSLPVAKLGLTRLRGASVGAADLAMILRLVQADCETPRPELVPWLLDALGRFGPLRAEWLLELLDSKHADVRAIVWRRLPETPLKDDPAVWQKLLESPYDDVKGPLVAELTERIRIVNFDAVRMLWASLLLYIHRGGRRKPGVVRQVVDRLAEHPDESARLLPLLAAPRHRRGPAVDPGQHPQRAARGGGGARLRPRPLDADQRAASRRQGGRRQRRS